MLPCFYLFSLWYCINIVKELFFNLLPLAPKLRAADLFRKAGAKISDLFAKLQIFSLKILKVFSGPKLLRYLSISFKSLTVFENAVDVSQSPLAFASQSCLLCSCLPRLACILSV